MPTRNVVLSDHQQALVESLVHSGRYQNASEVLREGLRLIERRDQEQAAKLSTLREAVDKGLGAVASGDYDLVDDANLDDYIRGLGSSGGDN